MLYYSDFTNVPFCKALVVGGWIVSHWCHYFIFEWNYMQKRPISLFFSKKASIMSNLLWKTHCIISSPPEHVFSFRTCVSLFRIQNPASKKHQIISISSLFQMFMISRDINIAILSNLYCANCVPKLSHLIQIVVSILLNFERFHSQSIIFNSFS